MERTIDRFFEESARLHGSRPFLRFEGETIRYASFARVVSRRAAGFARAGIGRGDRVGILLPNGPEFVEALFALLRLGATVVPVNHFLAAPEVAKLLERASVDAGVVGCDQLRLIEGVPDPPKGLFAVGGGGRGRPFEPLAEGDDLPPGCPRPGPDDAAFLLFTSGTEGEPRGVLLSHRNLAANVRQCTEALGPTEKERFLVFLPLFHTFTLTVCLLLPAALGAAILLFRSARNFPSILRDGILLGRATYFVGVPAVFNALARRRLPFLLRKLHRVRVMISGSAPLPARTVEAVEGLFGAPLLEGYGLTEAGPVVAVNLPGRRVVGTVGPPLPGVEVRVVRESGNGLMHGEVGELLVRGENVAGAFLGEESPVRDGWLRTGDLASVDTEGFITIHDRMRDLILVRGLNVYPREVEEAIEEHPSVAAAAVVRAMSETKGEVPRAFIVPAEGARPTAAVILGHLKGRLAPYKTPATIEFVAELPRSGTGKVLRRVLQARPLPPGGGA